MSVVVLRMALAAVLLVSASLKAASSGRSRAALGTFGVRPPWAQGAVLWTLVAVEAGVALGVAIGWTPAAYAGAAMSLAFAVALTAALLSGRRGAPCGCFGPGSRVRPAAIARDLALAAGFLAVAWLPEPAPTNDQWLALGLGVALAAIVALTVAVLALARQVGELRLAISPRAALDIDGEGPEPGRHSALIDRFEGTGLFPLAVFSSEGCPMCVALEPSVAALGRDPMVELRVFDEVRDADAWREASIPGAPYAVALDRDGTVLAKGTFNDLGQLESVLASAERRAGGVAHA